MLNIQFDASHREAAYVYQNTKHHKHIYFQNKKNYVAIHCQLYAFVSMMVIIPKYSTVEFIKEILLACNLMESSPASCPMSLISLAL